MTCRKFQKTLYSAKIDELDPAEVVSLEKHIASCEACRIVFEKVSNADRMLAGVKSAVPRIQNEQALTDSILTSIMKGEAQKSIVANTFLDRLSSVFCIGAVRFACCVVILFCGVTYLFLEYQDMKAIVNLEQRLGKQVDISQASIILSGNNVLRFLYDYYKLSSGSTSYVEITNKLILMKKNDLLVLMNNYQKLDKTLRVQLDEIQGEYLKEKAIGFGSSTHREEINALQKEIERLKKELEKINHMEVP
jgi:hypothetical protein